MHAQQHAGSLQRSIGTSGYFTLAFGATVGSGWVVVLGEWLGRAAPGGTVIGLLLGAVAMILIGACYAELAARMPRAGGEFLYALESFGPFPAFLVGWFITLYAVSACAFEAIALAWFLRTLFPFIAAEPLYFAFGKPVTLDALLIGIGAAIAVGVLHYRGADVAVRFQNIATYVFLIVLGLLVAGGLAFGSFDNLVPIFPEDSGTSWIMGSLWIFATSAFFLNGFQAALQGIEERRSTLSVRSVALAVLLAIVAAAAFYCLIVLAAGAAAPWRQTINAELPAAWAFAQLPGAALLWTVVLAAATLSLVKAWTALALLGTRLIFAQARLGYLPAPLARVSTKHGSPSVAIAFLTGCSVLGVLLGRSAVLAIVNMCSICLAVCFVVSIAALLRQRARPGQSLPAYQVPGGSFTIIVALLAAVAMAGVALLQPMVDFDGRLPLEWLLLSLWAALGAVAWLTARRGVAARPAH